MNKSPRLVPISDLAEINPQTVLPHRAECSFIGMEDVSENGEWLGNRTRLSSHANGYTTFQDKDVLFAKITPCMENGKGALVSGLVSGRGFGSTEFHVLRANSTSDPHFIAQWMQSRALRAKAAANMIGSAGQRRVPASFFEIFRVPGLPLSEQRKIAEILDTADEAIRTTERLIAKLKQARQGLLQDLLTRGIDESGHTRDPLLRPDQFVDSGVGRIPSVWQIKSISQLCHLGRGRVISANYLHQHPGPYPVYSSQSKDEGIFGYIDSYDFEGPTVTWTTDGAYAGTVFFRSGRFNCTNVCGTLRARDSSIDLYYLSLALQQRTMRHVSYIGNPKLMNNIVTGILLPVPPLHEQVEIGRIIDSASQRYVAEIQTCNGLRLLKRGLMDDLLTGRVRVSLTEGALA